ncbi:hypothetical protein WJX73_003639 [Symbiochloris irregularis]|uniref:Uncharacterized protein n=1 Tax=Symbiochloris irregularis TaxID=706552 RepID=A0AAW1NZ84_9CHLO
MVPSGPVEDLSRLARPPYLPLKKVVQILAGRITREQAPQPRFLFTYQDSASIDKVFEQVPEWSPFPFCSVSRLRQAAPARPSFGVIESGSRAGKSRMYFEIKRRNELQELGLGRFDIIELNSFGHEFNALLDGTEFCGTASLLLGQRLVAQHLG